MANEPFSKLNNSFNGAADAAKRTRIDARTAGFPADDGTTKVHWRGMVALPGKGDLWYVIEAHEESNKYLTQVNESERLVQIVKTIGKGKDENPLTFEQAVSQLAVWEHVRMLKGTAPIPSQEREDLGQHHYKDLVMRRGYLVTTTGNLAEVAGILPTDSGKYLKSDLEALQQYQDGLSGDKILNELIRSKNPLYVSETSIEEDLQSFGELGIFDKMRFFADILVHYAHVKLRFVQDFYADPTRKDLPDAYAVISKNEFFNKHLIDRFNRTREELAGGVFRFFHVARDDWDKEIDFESREVKIEILKNPDAKETFQFLTDSVKTPLQQKDIDTLLVASARILVYFRDLLQDSPQKDALERKGIYRQGDIDDLLNFLDLLEIKYEYMTLAEAAVALPGTQKHKELAQKKDTFNIRVAAFKDNLRDTGNLSAAQEKQVDSFIKASTPIYLLDSIAALPERLGNAYKYVAQRLLPPSAQLSLELDFLGSTPKRTVGPTRTTQTRL